MYADFSSLNSTKEDPIDSPSSSRGHKEQDLNPTSDSHHHNYLSHLSWGILTHLQVFPMSGGRVSSGGRGRNGHEVASGRLSTCLKA